MDRFEQLQQTLAKNCPDLELRTAEPMARHTTFHVGGPVPLMALPKSKQEAAQAVQFAVRAGIKPFFMGNGSNLLVPDEGVKRFVIKSVPSLNTCQVQGTNVIAGSGVSLSQLACFARDHALTGLEFAHGIPGTLGGAVFMNAGAYGGEMAQVIRRVTCLTQSGQIETVESFDFGYRHSVFSDGSRMILEAELALQPGDPDTITARMEELMDKRQSKQPLDYPSAGSTFKRPEGYYAAALIDQCGLKGLTVGGAQVSEKHAGFIINRGGATYADILALVEQVKQRVQEQTGVTLTMEVQILKESN